LTAGHDINRLSPLFQRLYYFLNVAFIISEIARHADISHRTHGLTIAAFMVKADVPFSGDEKYSITC